ncbi:MAG: anaerobic ribonucleoside-triphosphate reductase, partial [Candidatus Bathyarchaeia archaeon]
TAQKISREAEKRLLKLGTKYLTAPLIREFVNAILIEHGLEEYRHKLTRLGFPVYDVALAIKDMSAKGANVEKVCLTGGRRVIGEYTLLNVLPRDISDAHISGALNLNDLGSWILKIHEVMHDLRFFLKNGLFFHDYHIQKSSLPPPKTLSSALSLIADAFRLASTETVYEQVADYFNLFLAPYIKGLSKDEVKEHLLLFLESINLTVPTGISLGLETVLPNFLEEVDAIGPGGKTCGVYADYVQESHLIASLILECLSEKVESKPILNPMIIVKIRSKTFKDSEVESLLLKAHDLPLRGLTFYANLTSKMQNEASFTANGLRFMPNWKKDWEIDTIRTACLGHVTLNLPRLAYESEKDKDRFLKHLSKISEMGLRALEIKDMAILRRSQDGLLPFLLPKNMQDSYIRLENSLSVLGFIGLNESVHAVTGKSIYEGQEALSFADEIIAHLLEEQKDYTRNKKLRFVLGLSSDFDAAKRLVELDIERYGFGNIDVSGGRDNPYYTNMMIVPQEASLPLDDFLRIESHFEEFLLSHLIKIPLKESEIDSEDLLAMTCKIVKEHNVGLYIFDQPLMRCNICQKTFIGEPIKCPNCGSAGSIWKFTRDSARYRNTQF